MKRRRFFRALASDGVALIEELSGRPQLRLTDLWNYPDARLLAIRPMFAAGATVGADGGRMVGRRSRGEPIDLYGLDDPGTFVLCRFDGWSPLAGIADELATARDWPAERARACVKEVFLRLVALGLSVPANPLGDDDDPIVRNPSDSRGGSHE